MPRPRRLQTLLVAVALGATTVIAGPSAAADSANPTTVPWRPGAAPAGVGFWSNACNGDTSNPQFHDSVDGDSLNLAGQPALVAGASPADTAWALQPASSEVGPSTSFGSDLTDVSLQVKGPATGHLIVRWASQDVFGLLPIKVTATGWTSVLTSGSQLSWYKWSDGVFGLGNGYKAWNFAGDTNQHSLQEFASGPLGTGTALLAVELGCGTSPVTFDHFQISRTSGTTDYDFTNWPGSASLAASAAQIAPGASVTLTGTVVNTKTNAAPAAGTVQFQAAAPGQDGYTTIATTPVTGATYAVTPETTTRYRIVFPGSPDTGPSTSAPLTVQVTPTITAALSRSRLMQGDEYDVGGMTDPAHDAVAVSLQAITAGSWRTVDSTQTRVDGSYLFTRTADGSGTQQLRVVLAADAGNTGATSPTLALYTSVRGGVTARLTPARPRPGAIVSVLGKVIPARAGVRVEVQQLIGKSWRTRGTAGTTSTGSYRFTTKAGAPGVARFRVRALASGAVLAATSPEQRIVVTAPTTVSTRLSAATVKVGQRYALTGRTTPGRRTTVVVQRKIAGKWTALASVRTSARGRYRYTHIPTATGRWRLRVVVASSLGYLASRSRVVVLKVRAAPAPKPAPSPVRPPSSGGGSTGSSGGVGHG
jgi:hypothetical protein